MQRSKVMYGPAVFNANRSIMVDRSCSYPKPHYTAGGERSPETPTCFKAVNDYGGTRDGRLAEHRRWEMDMAYQPLYVPDTFNMLTELWSPRVVAAVNDAVVKVVKIEGEFVWHTHDDIDEMFFVVAGEMTIRFRDGEVSLRAGDMYVVPKGVEHQPVAESVCHVLLIEPKGVVNTGNVGGTLTAPTDRWL